MKFSVDSHVYKKHGKNSQDSSASIFLGSRDYINNCIWETLENYTEKPRNGKKKRIEYVRLFPRPVGFVPGYGFTKTIKVVYKSCIQLVVSAYPVQGWYD